MVRHYTVNYKPPDSDYRKTLVVVAFSEWQVRAYMHQQFDITECEVFRDHSADVHYAADIADEYGITYMNPPYMHNAKAGGIHGGTMK